MPNALAVVALAEKGAMFDPGPCVYMEKIAGGPDIADLLSLEDPIEDVLARIAERRGVVVGDLMVVMLDRPRHAEMVERSARPGARIRFISDGDVAGALLAAREDTGVDLLWGIGGTPEGVLAAAAIKCLGGPIFGRLWPRDEGEASRARSAGYDLDRVLTTDDLVARRQLLLRRHRRHRRRPAARRPLRPPRRDHPVDRDARPLGHGAPRRRPPRPREAARRSPASATAEPLGGALPALGRAGRLPAGDLRPLARRSSASPAPATTFGGRLSGTS